MEYFQKHAMNEGAGQEVFRLSFVLPCSEKHPEPSEHMLDNGTLFTRLSPFLRHRCNPNLSTSFSNKVFHRETQ